MARPLSTDLCRRLARLLPLLASDQPGEVAATAAAITRALKLAERDWHDLAAVLTSVTIVSPQPAASTDRAQAIDSEYVLDLVHNIRASGCRLTTKAVDFLDSLADRAGRYDLVYFSTKQWEWFVALLDNAGLEKVD